MQGGSAIKVLVRFVQIVKQIASNDSSLMAFHGDTGWCNNDKNIEGRKNQCYFSHFRHRCRPCYHLRLYRRPRCPSAMFLDSPAQQLELHFGEV